MRALRRLLLALTALPALAQAPGALEPAAPASANLIFKLGGQTDSTQGRALQGKVTWLPTDAFTVFLSGAQSNLASTTQAPSPNGNATLSTTTSLGGDYFYGRFDLGMQYDRSTLSDVLTSHRYYLQPAFEGEAWRLGFEFSTRTTDFDRLSFTNLTLNTPTGPVLVSGYADLSLKDTGLGASLEYNGEVWRPYASYTHYSYGSFEGSTDVRQIRNSGGMVSPDVFRALSGRLTNRLERFSATHLNGRAALLDATATAGIEANLSRIRWGLEATRDIDHLTHDLSSTYTGIAGWKVSPRFTLEFQLGATTAEAFGTDRFAGLALTYRTRPPSLKR